MEFIYYLIVTAGAIMVYGSDKLLKKIKKHNDIKYIIGLKFSGLIVAIIGMLLIFKVI